MALKNHSAIAACDANRVEADEVVIGYRLVKLERIHIEH